MNLAFIIYFIFFSMFVIIPENLPPETAPLQGFPPSNIELPSSVIFPANIKWQIQLNSSASSSAIDKNNLFLITDDSNMNIISIVDAKQISIKDERFSSVKALYTYKDLLYFVNDKSLFSFDKKNYQIKKVINFSVEIIQTSLSDSKLILLFDKIIGVYDFDKQIYKSFTIKDNFSFLSILLYKDKIIGIGKDGLIAAFDFSGNNLWKLNIKEQIFTKGVIYENILYQPADIYLYAIDLRNHSIKWKRLLGAKSYFPPEVNSENIYIVPINNLFYCLSRKASRKWVKFIKFRITARLLPLDDEIIVFPFLGEIISFSKKDGRQLGSFSSPIKQPILNAYYLNQKLILHYPEGVIALEKAPAPSTSPSETPMPETTIPEKH